MEDRKSFKGHYFGKRTIIVGIAVFVLAFALGAGALYASINWGGENDIQRTKAAIDQLKEKADQGDTSAQEALVLLEQSEREKSQLQAQLDQKIAEVAQKQNEIEQKQAEIQQKIDEGNAKVAAKQQEVNAKQQEVNAKQQELDDANAKLQQALSDVSGLADYAEQAAR